MIRDLLPGLVLLAALAAAPIAAMAQGSPQAQAETPPAAAQAPAISIPAPQPGISIPGGNDNSENDVFQKTMEMLSKLPPDTRDKLLQESQDSAQYCKSNMTLSNFYDCSCFALRILDQRIKAGPDMPFVNLVMQSDYSQCVFTPAIAGFGYQRCYQVVYMDKLTDDAVKRICGCAGRTLAANFASHPVSDAQYIDRLFIDALVACKRAEILQ